MADNLSTGKSQLNSQIVAGAATLAGPAAAIASGADAMKVATSVLKDSFMDKLLGPTAAFTGLLTGSLFALRKVVKESGLLEKGLARISSMQQVGGKFETLLKSATAAQAKLKELAAFASSSPFKFDSVAAANLQLLKLTKGAFAGKEAMTLVGDAAASAGVEFEDMANRVGRVHNAIMSNRGLDKVVFQLQQTGLATEDLIRNLEMLETTGRSTTEMWNAVKDVLKQTQGGMENEKKSIEALNRSLEESKSVMAVAFATPFVEAQEKSIIAMTNATKNLTPVVAQIGSDLSVVSGAFANFKAGIIDNTAALPGMAKGLEVVWEGARTAWLALAAMTAVSFVKGIGEMVAFGKSAIGAATDIEIAARSAAKLASAKVSLASAGTSAMAGDLKAAGASLIAAAATGAQAVAIRLHAAGMKGAIGTTGLLAAQNYVLAVSTVVAAKAASLAGIAFKFVAGAIRTATLALVTNPWTALAAALVIAATVIVKFIGAAKEAAKTATELADAAAAVNDELKKMRDAIKTADDWVMALQKLRDEYTELADAVTKYNSEVANGAEKTDEEKKQHQKNVTAAAAKRAALNAEKGRDLSKLGLSSDDIERIRKDQDSVRSNRDADFQRAQDAETDPAKKIAMGAANAKRLNDEAEAARLSSERALKGNASGEIAGLQGIASDRALSESGFNTRKGDIEGRNLGPNNRGTAKAHAAAKAKQAADLAALAKEQAAANLGFDAAEKDIRSNSGNEVTRVQQEITDATKRGANRKTMEGLHRKLSDAQDRVGNASQKMQAAKDAAAKQMADEKAYNRDQALSGSATGYDKDIAAATAKGNVALANQLTFEKEQARLKLEKLHAEEDNKDALAASLQAQLELNAATRANTQNEFKGNAAVERAANEAAIKGDKRGARAIRDADELRKMQKQYRDMGMTDEQATADFTKSLVADAAGRQPNAVATSLQSIGGGGGFSAGGDPIRQAQERAMKAQEKTAELNALILKALQGTPQ